MTSVQTCNLQVRCLMRSVRIVRALAVQHIVQLCVEEGLAITAISQAVGAAKKVVAHFKHSALATSELKNVRN